MRNKKKTILTKMLIMIAVPVACIFCLTAFIILQNVKQSITTETNSDLTAKSQSASHQISEYFTKYSEIATQMAANTQFENLFMETTPGTGITSADSYADAKKTMEQIQQSDPENIVDSWVADVDTSQLTQSDGYTSGSDYVITTRPWYQELIKKQALVITEPYQDTATKNWIVSVVAPVYQTGTKSLIGAVAVDFSLDNLYSMVQGYQLGNTGFYMLATGTGDLIYYPDKSMNNKYVTETDLSKNITDAVLNQTEGAITYTGMGGTNYGYLSLVGNTGWTITTGLPAKEYNGTYAKVQTTVLTTFITALLMMIALIFVASGSIVNPLKKLKNVAQKIADGDLNVEIKVKSADEVGQVAVALSSTVDRLKTYIEYIDEVSSVLDEIAVGNLTFKLQCDYVGEFAKIKTALDNIKSTLEKTFYNITQSAEQVSNGSDQVASASQSLAQGATEQASSIQELSASITEIANQVNRNASNASDASNLANQAYSEVQLGNEQMQKLIAAMADIGDSSKEINKIIKAIQDIAFQTNILALNAAVEAARAGAAGKGFAVVADEVRNLAGKSAEAAKNTTALIENSVHSVNNGTKIANETTKSLQTINAEVKKTTELINQISKASAEQAASINQVTLGVDQISSVVQNNSATSEESAASCEELNRQAKFLKSLVEKFKFDADTAKN